MIYDPLDDGCEIMYFERLGISEKGIRKLVRPKHELEVFMPVRKRVGRPDFSSREVMDEMAKRLKDKQ